MAIPKQDSNPSHKVKTSFFAVKFFPAQNDNALYGFVWSIQGKMMAGVKIQIRMDERQAPWQPMMPP
jgi:hypothetical protein